MMDEKKFAPIFSVAQIRECEQKAAADLKLDSNMLMMRAGSAAFHVFRQNFPRITKIAVLAGSGNNGGDGYIFAELCHVAKLDVTVWQVGDHHQLPEAANAAYKACVNAGVKIEAFTLESDLQKAEIFIDAICSIGLTENIRAELDAILCKIQTLKKPIMAMDIPTGIHADSGRVLGNALSADLTVTFIGLKLGLLTGAGASYAGDIICHDLGLDQSWLNQQPSLMENIDLFTYRNAFTKRSKNWHKGLSGHVLIIGGEDGFQGAPEMAALAALRVGAGLVSVATRVENAEKIAGLIPEVMCHGVTDIADLLPLLEKADVIVIGPGLGTSRWAKMLLEKVIVQDIKKVMDADALNLLAQAPMRRADWILTPHPGEAARLLHTDIAVVQNDRLAAVKKICEEYGGIAILKGAGSLIAEENNPTAICTLGNPGMATAGMGDVLSGVLGALIAQGMPLGIAAKVGVALHAYAGDLAAQKGQVGMIATDLMPYLRQLVNDIIEQIS